MSPFVRFPSLPLTRFLAAAAFAFALCLGADSAYCQKQEKEITSRMDTRGFRERMVDGPDQGLTSSFAGKSFDPRSHADTQKSATVRAFPFTKSALAKDFNTKGFAGAKDFRSKGYAGVKDAPVKAYAQTDKAFGTRAYAVQDDRLANKTFATRDFAPGQREGAIQKGKAQDTFDAVMQRKELSINQVRDLLNKNGDHHYNDRN